MMEYCRNFQIILLSATNLPNIRDFGEMKVYAEISINGESGTEKKTEADIKRGTNPRWNDTFIYTINESSLRDPQFEVVVKLYCGRSFGDKYIGQVKIPIKSLFDSGFRSDTAQSYAVSDTKNGTLDFMYSFGHIPETRKPSPKPLAGWEKALEAGSVVMVRGAFLGAMLSS